MSKPPPPKAGKLAVNNDLSCAQPTTPPARPITLPLQPPLLQAQNAGLRSAGVRARNQHAADRMPGAPKETSAAELIIARILMQDRRQHLVGHEVLRQVVGIGRTIALPISFEALSVRWVAVASLPQTGNKPVKTNAKGRRGPAV